MSVSFSNGLRELSCRNALTFCIRPVKEFETLDCQDMKHLNRITNLRNPLKPLLVLCGVSKRFIKRWLFFKPLYKIQKLIDPNSIFPIAKPRYPKYSRFVYMVCKWSL